MFSFNFSSEKDNQNENYFGRTNLDFGTLGKVDEDLWQRSFNSWYHPPSFNLIEQNQKELKTLNIIAITDSICNDNESKMSLDESQSNRIQARKANNWDETKENEDQCSRFLKPLPKIFK